MDSQTSLTGGPSAKKKPFLTLTLNPCMFGKRKRSKLVWWFISAHTVCTVNNLLYRIITFRTRKG